MTVQNWGISAEEMQRSGAMILLASGQTLRMRSVMLFDEVQLSQIALLRTEAAQKMGGVSPGIGFLGSPAWVLGAAAVTSLVSGAISSSSRSEGIQMLNRAQSDSVKVAENGHVFSLAELKNNQFPNPALWSAELWVEEKIYVASLGRRELAAVLEKYGMIREQISAGHLTYSGKRRFVHNGDDFIFAETDVGPIYLRWLDVIGYAHPKR